MKIVYIVEWDISKTSGVLQKILSQFKSWLEIGCDAELFFITPSGAEFAHGDLSGVSVFDYSLGASLLTKIKKYRSFIKIKERLEKNPPDIIYYRQSSWSPGVVSMLSSGGKLVVEINSDDSNEIYQYGYLKAKYHLLTKKFLIDAASGFVCVTEEIGEIYKKYDKACISIGNGYDVAGVPERVELYSADKINYVFVGSAGQAWHGVDKIIYLAGLMPECNFHIVGDSTLRSSGNIYSHGFLNHLQLSELYKQVNIGIASLALHRNKMNEASPLKTREYLSYGIPVIGGYRDTDLSGCDFYLELPNIENSIDVSINRIREFTNKWRYNIPDRLKILNKIDYKKKEIKRINFFKEIARL